MNPHFEQQVSAFNTLVAESKFRKPEDIAKMILAFIENDYITGQVIAVEAALAWAYNRVSGNGRATLNQQTDQSPPTTQNYFKAFRFD